MAYPVQPNIFVAGDDILAAQVNQNFGTAYAKFRFGGTGTDGTLTGTSTGITVDLGGAQVVVKNYTSISLTGTSWLKFGTPHANGTIVILKSQGNVTITTGTAIGIDLRSLGGEGGAQGVNGTGFGVWIFGTAETGGVLGTSRSGGGTPGLSGDGGGGGASAKANGAQGGGTASSLGGTSPIFNSNFAPYIKVLVIPGSGGGGGGNANIGAGAAGGRGAGALYIEGAGALNFTGTATATGINGSNAETGAYTQGGGGGGGGGGSVVILCNEITANSGSITVTKGSGGNSGGGTGGNGGDGADGYSYVGLNTEFV